MPKFLQSGYALGVLPNAWGTLPAWTFAPNWNGTIFVCGVARITYNHMSCLIQQLGCWCSSFCQQAKFWQRVVLFLSPKDYDRHPIYFVFFSVLHFNNIRAKSHCLFIYYSRSGELNLMGEWKSPNIHYVDYNRLIYPFMSASVRNLVLTPSFSGAVVHHKHKYRWRCLPTTITLLLYRCAMPPLTIVFRYFSDVEILFIECCQ